MSKEEEEVKQEESRESCHCVCAVVGSGQQAKASKGHLSKVHILNPSKPSTRLVDTGSGLVLFSCTQFRFLFPVPWLRPRYVQAEN